MAAGDYGFNGSTFTFGEVIAEMRSIDCSESVAAVDVTASADEWKTYTGGIPDDEATVELVGSTDIMAGDIDEAVVAWNDGGEDDLGNSLVTKVGTRGGMDQEILTTITIKPASEAGSPGGSGS
jgi:hypothetical protein